MSDWKRCIRAFTAVIDGERVEIAENENVDPRHELVRDYPENFRTLDLEMEMEIRSARIAEINDATRVTSYEPQSESGKREQREAQFWAGVTRMLDPGVPAAERAEQRVFDEGQQLIEEIGRREFADFNADAERAFGFDRDGWARRTAG